MTLRVFLDDQDITASLNAQFPLPAHLSKGVFPDRSHDKWWDLWACIQANPTLKENFQNNAVHFLTLQDDVGNSYEAELLLRTKYSARNR